MRKERNISLPHRPLGSFLTRFANGLFPFGTNKLCTASKYEKWCGAINTHPLPSLQMAQAENSAVFPLLLCASHRTLATPTRHSRHCSHWRHWHRRRLSLPRCGRTPSARGRGAAGMRVLLAAPCCPRRRVRWSGAAGFRRRAVGIRSACEGVAWAGRREGSLPNLPEISFRALHRHRPPHPTAYTAAHFSHNTPWDVSVDLSGACGRGTSLGRLCGPGGRASPRHVSR